jgi:hypothetical protein
MKCRDRDGGPGAFPAGSGNRMKTIALWTLVALNAALAVAVAGRLVKGNVAVAQQAPVANGHDDFLMIPGEIVGGNNAIVYVIDETTHQLSSMSYDDAMHRLVTMAPRSMDRDFLNAQNGNGGGGRRGR